MKKRLLAIITTLALAVAFAIPTFAAGTITSAEQGLLDEFKAGVTTKAGVTLTPPASYVSQAESVLLKDDFDDHQIAILRAALEAVYGEVAKTDAKNFSEVKAKTDFSSLVSKVEAACAKVGYNVTINSNGTATVKSNDGKTSVTTSKVKQTGFDMTATVVSALALVGVLSAGAVVISKKELLAD